MTQMESRLIELIRNKIISQVKTFRLYSNLDALVLEIHFDTQHSIHFQGHHERRYLSSSHTAGSPNK